MDIEATTSLFYWKDLVLSFCKSKERNILSNTVNFHDEIATVFKIYMNGCFWGNIKCFGNTHRLQFSVAISQVS